MIKIQQNITWSDILESNGNEFKIVYFGAKWCGPCKTLKPMVESIGEKNKETITVYDVDIDSCDTICNEQNITSVPTVIVLKNNKKLKTIVGNNYQELINTIQTNL